MYGYDYVFKNTYNVPCIYMWWLGTFVGLKMVPVAMADQDVFMNPFGGLFDLKMQFYI